MADFIPQGDAEAIAHGKNLIEYVTGNAGALNLEAGDYAPLKNALHELDAKYGEVVSKKAESEAASASKTEAREIYETELRKFNSKMQHAGDEHRAGMGLNVRDDEPTSIGAPVSHPVGEIETSEKNLHVIHFRDALSPDSRGKPHGVMGAQIYLKIGGDPPVDDKECEYIATDSRTPYNCPFDGADAGKTAYYLLRWINSKGETGPWSPLVQATITG